MNRFGGLQELGVNPYDLYGKVDKETATFLPRVEVMPLLNGERVNDHYLLNLKPQQCRWLLSTRTGRSHFPKANAQGLAERRRLRNGVGG
jgi:hypothetical protein